MSVSNSSLYRPEIDGLRAVAVVAVIINHFNEHLLPGGFLGVDIFFVISGYVITSSLLSRGAGSGLGHFLGSFYSRRIRRLYPALFVYLVLVGIFLVLFKLEPGSELDTGIFSVFGFSNIYLYLSQSNYFAESSALNPFTQTWSLGVEEQFYLLFPFLVWFSGVLSGTRKSLVRFRGIVAMLSLISLVLFIAFAFIDNSAAYYLVPMRFWEIGLGALVCTWIYSGKRETVVAPIVQLIAFALAVLVMFVPPSFGVFSTPFMVIVSAFLLFALSKGCIAYSMLSSPLFVAVGLMSYSLYLWHWGVLVVSRLTIGVHWWSVLFQLILIFVFAIISYRYVELPFRKKGIVPIAYFPLNKVSIFAKGLCASIAVAGFLLFLKQEGNFFFLGDPVLTKREKDMRLGHKSCIYRPPDGPFPACEVKSDVEEHFPQRLLILGDSHAQRLAPFARLLSSRINSNISISSVPGSPFPPLRLVKKNDLQGGKKGYMRQMSSMDSLFKFLREGDVVLIYNSGSYFSSAKSSLLRYPRSDWSGNDRPGLFYQLEARLLELKALARKKGIKIVFALPTPHFDKTDREACFRHWFQPESQQEACSQSKLRERVVGKFHTDLVKLVYPIEDGQTFYVFDPLDSLCGDRQCQRLIDGRQMYVDGSHLSFDGSETLANEFYEFWTSRSFETRS